MTLSTRQRAKFRAAIKEGLSVLYRPPPMTAVEHADKYFYMSAESSYIEGDWKTAPYQIAILNAMGNDDIEEVNFQKSARVGYTKLVVACMSYFVEHKKRNVMAWFPDDGSRDVFSKTHIDPAIRDIPVLKNLFPWFDKKHKKNTIDAKVFSNQKQLMLRGGKAAKNYREASVDVGIYDELSKFDADIEKEGSPTFLGDKRMEGSVFRKSIRGSTPALKDSCMMEEACSEAENLFWRYIPCVHCGEFQVLKFGGKDLDYGLMWDNDAPDHSKASTVRYCCPKCGGEFDYADYIEADYKGYWQSDQGLTTYDGIEFTDKGGNSVETPLTVAFRIWSAYSHFSPWSRIVKDWIKIGKNKEKLKSFVNTTLGETWEEIESEKLDHMALYGRREHYAAEVPIENCVLTAAVDTQDDRFEIDIVAWVAGEESYRISYERLYGDLSKAGIWQVLAERLGRSFVTPSGVFKEVALTCIDSGGHFTDEVYEFSKHYGLTKYIPIKGSSIRGMPIAKYPRTRNAKGVYLTQVGTDTAKELLAARFKILEPGEAHCHWPISDEFDEDYFKQLTNERRYPRIIKGKRLLVWDAKGKRNEPWDTAVYNLVAVRILQQHRGYNLEDYIEVEAEKVQKIETPKKQKSFINVDGDWL